MAKRAKQQPQTAAPDAPLALARADGAPLATYPPAVVGELRGTVTRLVAAGPLPHSVALVAALRQEGVTYLAQALAATIAADLERRVCVVELNWHWPALGGGAPGPGLAGVLAGEASLDEALVATSLAGLALLPAGALPEARRSVAARGAPLREQIAALAGRFDHLVIDAPAVLATSDAILLAGLAEACAVVVRQGVTPRPVLLRALDDLRHLSMLGVLMNRVRIATPRWVRGLVPQE